MLSSLEKAVNILLLETSTSKGYLIDELAVELSHFQSVENFRCSKNFCYSVYCSSGECSVLVYKQGLFDMPILANYWNNGGSNTWTRGYYDYEGEGIFKSLEAQCYYEWTC